MIGSGAFISNCGKLRKASSLRSRLVTLTPATHTNQTFRSDRGWLSTRIFLILVVTLGIIAFTGCSKKKEVMVPDLQSQPDLDHAEKALIAAGLKPGNISGTPGPGAYVVSQKPAAGQQVAPDSTVDLVVEVPIAVPTLTSSNLTDAVTQLQGLGLKVGFVKKSSFNPFGTAKIEQQEPAPNSPMRSGGVVTLTVSTPHDFGGLLGLVSKEPAYQNLKPEYKNVLDAFLGNPSTPRSMEPGPAPPTQ